MRTKSFRNSSFFRYIAFTVLTAFVGMLPVQSGYAQVAIVMPPVDQMIHVTSHFEPPQMVGLKINLKDPFSFGFIMDRGESPMSDNVKKEEFNKIIKYFLVSLAMPNKDMWVNLSPFESRRIIPEVFGQTEMGRDLLAQDYILKQFTASLMYPEDGLGKEFWDKVYAQAQARFGTTDINVNTFNKVWIVADHADVYQKGDTAFLVGSHLKVMLEQDFKAIEQNKEQFGDVNAVGNDSSDAKTQMASQLVREIIIPAIEKEVNEGQSFAAVRQIYNAEIMATWFKKTLRASLLGQVFADKSRIGGQKVSDPQAKEKIFQQYLLAYKRGVFNFVKREVTADGQVIPRRYLSGGVKPVGLADVTGETDRDITDSIRRASEEERAMAGELREEQPAAVEQRIAAAPVSQRTPLSILESLPMAQISDKSLGIALETLVRHFSPTDATVAQTDRIRQLVDQIGSPEAEQSPATLALLKKELAEAAPRFIAPMANPETLFHAITQTAMPQQDQTMVAATILTPQPEAAREVEAFRENTADNPRMDLALVSMAPAAQEAPIVRSAASMIAPVLVESAPESPQDIATMLAQLTTPATETVTADAMRQKISDLMEEYRQKAGNRQAAENWVTEKLNQAQASDLGASMDRIQSSLAGQFRELSTNAYLPLYVQLRPEQRQDDSAIRDYVNASKEIAAEKKAEAIENLMLIKDAQKDAMNTAIPELTKAVPQEIRDRSATFVERLAGGMVERIMADSALLNVAPKELRAQGVTPSLSSAMRGIEENFTTATGTVERPQLELYNRLLTERSDLMQGANESAVRDMLEQMAARNQIERASIADVMKIRAAHLSAAESAARELNLAPSSAQELAGRLISQAAVAANGAAANNLNSAIRGIEEAFRSATETMERPQLALYSKLLTEQPKVMQGADESAVRDMLEQMATRNQIERASIADVMKIRAAQLSATESAARELNLSPASAQDLTQQMVSRASENSLGGINLSDEHLTMNVKVDGAGMPLPPQYQDQALLNLNGLVSIIRSITPLTQQNVPALYEQIK